MQVENFLMERCFIFVKKKVFLPFSVGEINFKSLSENEKIVKSLEKREKCAYNFF
jgi:hypothetical protein